MPDCSDPTTALLRMIAVKDAEIARLNSAFDDCAENANASQAEVERQAKVIAALRKALQNVIDLDQHWTDSTHTKTKDGVIANYARGRLGAIEQTAGESK
jgi:hypothetical protein